MIPFFHRPGRYLRAGLLACLLASSVLLGGPAWAQPSAGANAVNSDTTAGIDAQLTQMRARLDAILKGLDNHPTDESLDRWGSEVQRLQSRADGLAGTLTPKLADITARLNQLGPVPTGTKEPPDVADQRKQLVKANNTIDSQLKLAKLLTVEAGQLVDRVSTERRKQFQAQMGERHRTFFSSRYHDELRRDFPADLQRFEELGDEVMSSAGQTPGTVWFLILAGMVAVLAANYVIRRLLLRLTSARVPSGRLRRSVFAVAVVIVAIVTPGLIAKLLHLGVNWTNTLSDNTEALMSSLVGVVSLAGYIGGLGNVLLSPKRPSWRLLPLPDEVAAGLRWLPGTLAAQAVLIWLALQLPAVLDISVNTTIAMTSLAALALGITLAWSLMLGERLRRKSQRDPETGQALHRSFWIATLSTLSWLALVVGIVAVLIGYATLGTFIITQGLWLLIVATSAYLLSLLINDGFMTLLAGKKPEHPTPQFRLRQQTAVLLSGTIRAMVVLVAIVLLINPFGGGPTEILHSAEQLGKGLQIGQVLIQPSTLGQGLVVLLLGLLCVRVLKRWLRDTYLPSTTMDPGMRTSTATLFGYAGVLFVAGLTLSSLGLGLERVAWIASALSVGIGFGLQAVVQNFVSGLILLAERPVKVGDWVSLGTVEGDIQRINVRATEILMSDKSTVIVPNSEFITKTLRNVTHSRSMGRVQIKLPMPLDTDADKVRDLITAVFVEQEEILHTPAAMVYLDGIENDRLIFNAIAYVDSPRVAYIVRSRVLYEVLGRLAQAGLPISASSTVVLQGSAGLPLAGPPPQP
jgi:small-conductance mechanosensitive channel